MLGPNGGIGRRDGFKIRFLTECRFKSGFGYHTYFYNYMYLTIVEQKMALSAYIYLRIYSVFKIDLEVHNIF